MTVYELINKYYPEDFKKIDEKFPNMMETAKETEVIPWQEEFQVADKNADAFEKIEFLHELLKNQMISEEKYLEEVRKMPPSSITKGIAIIEEKKVSFRDKIPGIGTIFHELGHIHFKEDDRTWNAMYGGGEVYAGLVYKDLAELTEEQIKKYMKVYREIYNTQEMKKLMEIYKILSKIIVKGTEIPEDLIAAQLYAGTMPSYEVFKNPKDLDKIFNNQDHFKIKKIIEEEKVKFNLQPLKSMILIFISAGFADGYRYGDPFYKTYAENFFKNIDIIIDIIGEQIEE